MKLKYIKLSEIRLPHLHKLARHVLYAGLGVVTAAFAGVAVYIAAAPPEKAYLIAASAPLMLENIAMSLMLVVCGALVCDMAVADAQKNKTT